jgi:hypothetical protein
MGSKVGGEGRNRTRELTRATPPKPLISKNACRCRSAESVNDAGSEIKPTTASKRLHFRAPGNTVGVRFGVRLETISK